MKYTLILFLFLLGNIPMWSIGYIEIGSKDIDPCKWRTALEFISAFEQANMNQLAFFLNEKTRYDLSKIKKYSKEIKGQVSGCRYYEGSNTSYLKRIYTTYANKKEKYLFELTLYFQEENPYVFKEIKLSTNVKMPKELKKRLKKLKHATREEGYKIMTTLMPPPPPTCHLQCNAKKKSKKVYIETNLYYFSPDSFNTKHLNESNFPLDLQIRSVDSIKLPSLLFELKRLEKLTMTTRDVEHIPEKLFELKNLKSLTLLLSESKSVKIPASIRQLTSLEALTIHSYGTVLLPTELTQLKKLREFKFKVSRTDKTSTEVVHKIHLDIAQKVNGK